MNNMFTVSIQRFLIAAAFFVAADGIATSQVVERPPIVCVAHFGLKTDDLAAARRFYGDGLGFKEPFTVDKPAGGLMLTYFKVNDHQYIEVFPELKSATEDRLSHIAFETTSAQQLRDYLASKGVKVPAVLKPGLDGNLSFMTKDPDGHNVRNAGYSDDTCTDRPSAGNGTQVESATINHANYPEFRS